jgi:quercetin dioxygenase-like cupin family protein
LEGEMRFHYDEQVEVARQGEVHYCPRGHRHWFENSTDRDVKYLAIVI